MAFYILFIDSSSVMVIIEAAKARKASWASIQLSDLSDQTRPETMNKPGHMLAIKLETGCSGSSS